MYSSCNRSWIDVDDAKSVAGPHAGIIALVYAVAMRLAYKRCVVKVPPRWYHRWTRAAENTGGMENSSAK